MIAQPSVVNTDSELSNLMVSDENIVAQATVKACRKGRKEMFDLTTHSTHFIYGYMVSDIW